jgi:putative inorganic carbon (HCO3(-)) transporter
MERLTFNVGSSRRGPLVVSGRQMPRGTNAPAPASRLTAITKKIAATRERYDWDYLWMLAFTALVFFRPQDHFKPLESLHLAELTAIAGLAAMAVRRLRFGQTIAKVNTEVIAVIMLGAVIVLTIPFSIWPGGSLKVFSDIYVKIILIFALMMSTITSPRRLRQMMWVMIVASGYIAGRGVFDYLRGVNLVEGNRLRGAVGGMFENPNDLALNLVTFLAPTLFIIIQDKRPSRRIFASLLAVLMLAATVFTKSRSGFLGLIAMGIVVIYYTARMKPGVVFGVVLAGLLALPVMPSSFWSRMDGIMNAEADPTGSRAARVRLLNQGLEVFAANPLTGIGAGQFQNYNAPGVIEKWRVTHNVWLQVASELGIFGFLVFLFLVVRAYWSNFRTLRMLRMPRKRKNQPAPPEPITMTPQDRAIVDTNAKGMIAALVGWTVCSLFASVAFNWTFYYVLALAVAGREIVASRRTETVTEPEPKTVPARLVRAHA